MIIIVMTQIDNSAVFPKFYSYRDGIDNDIMSVNGSSEDGNCNLTPTAHVQCREPTTSVLQGWEYPHTHWTRW